MGLTRAAGSGLLLLALAACSSAGPAPIVGRGTAAPSGATGSAGRAKGVDTASAFVDPARSAAGTASVPGPSARQGIVVSLPASAVPVLKGYVFTAGKPSGVVPPAVSTASPALISGTVTRSVRHGATAIGWVTVYRLTAQARTDPNTEMVLLPSMIAPFAGKQLPVTVTLSGLQVHRASAGGGAPMAMAWHQDDRVTVIWGPDSGSELRDLAARLIAAG